MKPVMCLNTCRKKINPDVGMNVNATKIYFLSDFHLGAPDAASSLEREKRICRFLDIANKDAHTIFIVGDLFDFWFEYSKVVPKGYVRILGKLAELTDSGIAVHFFVGNHDMWMSTYFQNELNISVYFEPKTFVFNNKKFLIVIKNVYFKSQTMYFLMSDKENIHLVIILTILFLSLTKSINGNLLILLVKMVQSRHLSNCL